MVRNVWIHLGDKGNLSREIAVISKTSILCEYSIWASDQPDTGQFNVIQSTYDIYGNPV